MTTDHVHNAGSGAGLHRPEDKEKKIPCEVYSRIVGYLRPVRNWHEGKRREFEERRTFRVLDANL